VANKYNHIVGVRLSDEHITKLHRLAETTYRGRGDVLRCLIDSADALMTRDLVLAEPIRVPRVAQS
jgi:hypothetical protein